VVRGSPSIAAVYGAWQSELWFSPQEQSVVVPAAEPFAWLAQ